MPIEKTKYSDRDIEMITFIFEVRPILTEFEARLLNDRLEALKAYSRNAVMSAKQRSVIRRVYAKAKVWPLRPFPVAGD